METDIDASARSVRTSAGVMLLAMFAAFFAQMVMGALGPTISNELEISASFYGPVVSIIFVSALACSPLVGRLQRRLSLRGMFVGLFGLGTLGLTLIGSAPNTLVMGLALAVSGAALAVAHPATNALVATATPPSQWGTVMGVKQAGQMVSAVSAGSLLPLIAARFGWRTGVLATALLVAVLSVPAVLALRGEHARTPARSGRSTRAQHQDPGLITLLTLYTFFMAAGLAVLGVYLPLYAFDVLGWSASRAGQLVGLLGVFGLLARLGWGRAVDRGLVLRHAILVIAAAATACVLLLVLATPDTSWLLWVAAIGIGSTASAQSTVVMVFAIHASESDTVGLASARIQVGFFTAFIVSPALFGTSLAIDDGYTLGWTGVTVAWIAAGLVALRLRPTADPV